MFQFAIIEMNGSIPHLVTIGDRDNEADARQDFEEYVRDEASEVRRFQQRAYANFVRNVGTVKVDGKTVAKFYFDNIG